MPRSAQTARTRSPSPRPAVAHEPEGDVVAERRREAGRGEIALVVLRREGRAGRQHMRAGDEPRAGLDRPKPDELLAADGGQRRSRGAHLADAVLAGRDHPAEPEVGGGGAPVQLGVGEKALFDAEHVQRLEPVGTAAERRRLGQEALKSAAPKRAGTAIS